MRKNILTFRIQFTLFFLNLFILKKVTVVKMKDKQSCKLAAKLQEGFPLTWSFLALKDPKCTRCKWQLLCLWELRIHFFLPGKCWLQGKSSSVRRGKGLMVHVWGQWPTVSVWVGSCALQRIEWSRAFPDQERGGGSR